MTPSKAIFNQIDMYCNECSHSKEAYEKERRKELQALAQSTLWDIINKSEDDKDQRTAKVALQRCIGCNNYEQEIHKYLITEKMI